MSWKTSFSVLAAVLISVSLSNAQNASTCYSPDGSVLADHSPCGDPSKGPVACCYKDTYCMEEGLCLSDTISRGSCTDKNWESEVCSPWCKNVYANNGCSIALFKDYPERIFCCAPPYNSAADNETCFGQDGLPGTGFAFPGPGQPWPRVTGYANSSYGNLYPWLNIATTAADGSMGSNLSFQAVPSPTNMPTADHTTRNIGIGVGVGLGVLFFVALGFAIWQMTRVSRLQKQLDEKLHEPSHQPGGWYAAQPSYTQVGTGYKPAPQHELEGASRLYELPEQRGSS